MKTSSTPILLTLIITIALLAAPATAVLAGTFGPITVTDQTPAAPLANPVPSSYQPRYLSGFGSDNSFTVFFEDRDAGQAISFVQTNSGPTGFPASVTATNIADTHFVVKDWPIEVGGPTYAYRGWGAVGNNPQHHFYVSNDLTNWTLVSTFTIPNAAGFTDDHGWVYYGFHDVIKLNGTYYAFAESNQSQTMLVRSANGDDVWEAFASIGGHPGWGPLELPAGVSAGWTPSGSFFDLGDDRGMGKIHVDPRDSAFYLAVNTAAKLSLSPADLEAAFINPANWTWHDGTTGPAANPILSETSEHDLREAWLVPSSNPNSGWAIIYDADFGSADGGKALGYATLMPPLPPPDEVWVDDGYDGTSCSDDGHSWGYDCFDVIQDGVDAVTSGGTVHVAAGTYAEAVKLTPGEDLTITGAGCGEVTWFCPADDYCIDGDMAGYTGSMAYEISGITFNVRSQPVETWGAGIGIRHAQSGPLSLSIHDNCFVEDRSSGDSTHWGTSMMLCHNRFATRDGSGNGAVRIFDNVDQTWGGLTMSNSQAYDIHDNVFDGCSDAIYNGHGCPDTAGQAFGDHHIYDNVFRNASDDLHPGGSTPAIDWQYYGGGGGAHLPSTIEHNLFESNDTAVRFWMDTDMIYPAHTVQHNCFVDNGWAFRAGGDIVSSLNTEYNWWGANSGPTHAGNPDGTGDPVTDFLDYDPWIEALSFTGQTLFSVSEPVILQASLTASAGGMPGVEVEFYMDGGAVGTATTGADGVASLNIDTQTVGVHAATARALCLQAETPVVIYDPDGGFVTGGGWIDSEPGACQLTEACEDATGKATFGFVAKYNKKTKLPEGNTEFKFKAGGLNFRSASYDWLLVNKGGSRAQFKGEGTINGEGAYKFMLWAADGDPDTFRIKIWEEDGDGEQVAYDNGYEGSGYEGGQPISGGNIVVHTKSK